MDKVERHLTLCIPHLLAAPLADKKDPHLKVRELEYLLTRSQRSACAADPETLLFTLFGITTDKDHPPPIAPLTYALDSGGDAAGWYVRADPVYMHADSDRVLLLGNECLNITRSEVSALEQELCPFFMAHDAHFSAPATKRWYLQLAHDPQLSWHSLQDARGWDIHRFLATQPQGSDPAKRWRRILNEVQMLLHGSNVNQHREQRGELPINSLWFWGAGTLPARPEPRFAQVWSNEPLSLALARFTRAPRRAAPDGAQAWLAQAITPGEHFVMLERETPPSAMSTAPQDPFAEQCNGDRYTENEAMLTQRHLELSHFNSAWFAPLWRALKARDLAGLRLFLGSGQAFHITPRSVARWWWPTRHLNTYANSAQHASASPDHYTDKP